MRNLYGRLWIEILHLHGNDPDLFTSHCEKCLGIKPLFTCINGRVDWTSAFNNGMIEKLLHRKDPMDFMTCDTCEDHDNGHAILHANHRAAYLRVFGALFELTYSIGSTIFVEKCVGLCSAEAYFGDRHDPCNGPYARHQDGVNTFGIETDTLMAIVMAITGSSKRLTSYAHTLRSSSNDCLQQFRRKVEEWAGSFEEGSVERQWVEESFMFLTEEWLEEGHKLKKRRKRKGGGNLGAQATEERDLLNQSDGKELAADASQDRRERHGHRKRSGKEATWDGSRREAGRRDQHLFRPGTGVGEYETVGGATADFTPVGRTFEALQQATFTDAQIAAGPTDDVPVAELCGSFGVDQHGHLSGSGPLHDALEEQLTEIQVPTAMDLPLIAFEVVGAPAGAAEYIVTEKGSVGGLKMNVAFVLQDSRLRFTMKEAGPEGGQARILIGEPNTFALYFEEADDAGELPETMDEGAELHLRVVLYSPDAVWRSPTAKVRNKWFPVKTGNESPLIPKELLTLVHFRATFDGACLDDLRGLMQVINGSGSQGWELPGNPADSTARLALHAVMSTDNARLARGPRVDDVARTNSLTAETFDPEVVAEKVQGTVLRRARSAICQQRSGASLGVTKCVCLLPDRDESGNYRGTQCWACQFRLVCPFCRTECVPASAGSEHGAGSHVGVNDSVLHEECTGDKHLLPALKAAMVVLKVYDHDWVYEAVDEADAGGAQEGAQGQQPAQPQPPADAGGAQEGAQGQQPAQPQPPPPGPEMLPQPQPPPQEVEQPSVDRRSRRLQGHPAS